MTLLSTSLLTLASGRAAPNTALRVLQDRADLEAGARSHVRLEPGTALRAVLEDAPEGWLETPTLEVPAFDTAVVSWNAATPAGTGVKLEVRARVGGRWTAYYPVAEWSTDPRLPRRSYEGKRDADGRVDTDTLKLTRKADALAVRTRLFSRHAGVSPTLSLLATVTSDSGQHKAVSGQPSTHAAWGTELPVPVLSQMVYPDGGEVWCSPTSVSMVLGYWGARLGRGLADPVPVAAKATWDVQYAGSGNWPFNTAYAGSKGLVGYVARFSSLSEVEAFIRRGVPLALSIGWGKGELEGAHVPVSGGHLVVLRGFTASGDPIINDPAAKDNAGVRTVYRRGQFERAWVRHSGGIAYVIEPPAPR